jgi:Fur family peroxide stress response transcriptional regulator
MNAEEIIAKLREKGFKVTPQRLAICELVLSSKDHPTAEQLHQKLKAKHPTVSLATVYQTLHLLTEIGLLQELGFSERISRYDPNTSPHINVLCEKCGRIWDYQAENIGEFWSHVIKDLGIQSIGQRLDIYTYCDDCVKPTRPETRTS